LSAEKKRKTIIKIHMLILKVVKTTGIAFPDYASSKEILDVPRNTNMMEVCQPVVAKTWIELNVKQNVR